MKHYNPEKLREARLKAGHRTLGEAVDAIKARTGWRIYTNALSRWENGRAIPRTENLIKLAYAYKVGTDYFSEED